MKYYVITYGKHFFKTFFKNKTVLIKYFILLIQVVLMVLIASTILVDAGKKNKLLKRLKKELGYDLKEIMEQVCKTIFIYRVYQSEMVETECH